MKGPSVQVKELIYIDKKPNPYKWSVIREKMCGQLYAADELLKQTDSWCVKNLDFVYVLKSIDCIV